MSNKITQLPNTTRFGYWDFPDGKVTIEHKEHPLEVRDALIMIERIKFELLFGLDGEYLKEKLL